MPKDKKPPAKASTRTPKATRKDPKATRKPAKAPKSVKPKPDRRGTPKGAGIVKTKGGGRIGNPPFRVTVKQRRRVEAMAAGGAKQWVIAEDLRISIDTLERHFRKELDTGEEKALGLIGASFMERALAGDHDAQKYVLARRAGWKQTTTVEQSGPNGGPIVYTSEPPRRDLSALTDEEIEQWERLTAKVEAGERPGDE